MGKEPYPSESEAIAKAREIVMSTMEQLGDVQMPAKVCKNCKHWSGRSAALPPGMGFCNLAKNFKRLNKFVQAPGGLITSPEFGCNQYQVK